MREDIYDTHGENYDGIYKDQNLETSGDPDELDPASFAPADDNDDKNDDDDDDDDGDEGDDDHDNG